MKLFSYSLLFFIMLGLQAYAAKQSIEPQCGDFLASFTSKPKALQFQSCDIAYNKQAKPMIARYHVTGKQAAEVEKFLIKNFAMPSLYFVCCIWESVDKLKKQGYSINESEFLDPKTDIRYYITMISDETLVNKRQNWPEIPYFYVNVYTYTEEI